ncbi:hypothetical protein EDC04DRAFT_2572847 [Pisolithus marmoratus]|nr:hypothetical protein EDC04DRAFT_2572847 [Pisolithus marmoratus]
MGIKLLSADNFDIWFFLIAVLGDSLNRVNIYFCSLTYWLLMFRFVANYPTSAATAKFVVDQTTEAPFHPHICSNGHEGICESILGMEWSQVLSVSSVCIMLQSMLASCKVRGTLYFPSCYGRRSFPPGQGTVRLLIDSAACNLMASYLDP